MKKLKNEKELVKKAIAPGVAYDQTLLSAIIRTPQSPPVRG